MMNCKKVSLGLVAAMMLVTPAMAQVVYQKPGVMGFSYPNSTYVRGHAVRTTTPPGYYYGNRFHPAPRVGAFATAPWSDGSSGVYGSLGLVDRQW
jgi:hypothetical protein